MILYRAIILDIEKRRIKTQQEIIQSESDFYPMSDIDSDTDSDTVLSRATFVRSKLPSSTWNVDD
jgi:hypothetical protein